MPTAKSTSHQSSFLGGEWGQTSQGRSDLPEYKIAMNVCLNGFPTEEGSWQRRPAFQWMGYTRLRAPAKLLPFLSKENTPLLLSFTDGRLRFFYGTGPVCTDDRRTVSTSSLSAGGLTLGLDADHGWTTGEHVVLAIPASVDAAARGPLLNRVYDIQAVPTTSSITLYDDLTQQIAEPVSLTDDVLAGTRVFRIKEFTTAYGVANLPLMRVVQEDTKAFVLNPAVVPCIVELTDEASGDGDPVLTFVTADFQDGPYLDPQPDTGTASAYTGSITFTPASSTFVSTDVGRLIRLFSEPAAWDAAHTYTYGETAAYNNQYWRSIAQGSYASENVGIVPGTIPPLSDGVALALWAPAPTEGQWAWGKITAQAGSSCTVQLHRDLNSANGATVKTWRLGLFTAGSYPACGVYHEGRLHLGGAVGNRGDASVPNDPLNFAPTDVYGVVADDAAISYTLNAKDTNQFYWMEPDHQGIIIGTAGGEWLLSASELNDPLTPTSRQAHRVTKIRAKNVEPRRTSMALMFAQLYGRRLMEYLADTFSGRFSGRHTNERAKHLTKAGIAEIEYQQETAPIVWSRMEDNTLKGNTYRRDSRFVTEPPVFSAWHQHALGGAYNVTSMTVLPGIDGLTDRLYVVTKDPGTGYYSIEVLTPLFEDINDD